MSVFSIFFKIVSNKGTPLILTRHFGVLLVIGFNLSPLPAAKIKAFIN